MLVVLPVSRQSLFCNKHFKPTVEGAEDTVPYAWLRETPTIVLDLTGGMVADDAVDEADEVPCDGELGGEATPSLHSLVFSHEGDARSVGTPSLHTIVPASYAASRRSGVRPASGTPSLHTYCVGVNTSQAAASSNDTPSLEKCVEDHVEYLPDVALYPRYGARKKEFTPEELGVGQAEQCARCPICKLDDVVPAGVDARAKFRRKWNDHMHSRHSAEERKLVPRLGSVGVVVETCVELPDACKSWECSVCHEFLPLLPNRNSRDLSIAAHFKKRHPGITPSEAYHQKQREDPQLRSRMLKRGQHAGSVKRKCSDEVMPWSAVSLAWMREHVKFDRRNLEVLSAALHLSHLSDEEKTSLVVSAFRMHFKQPGWFVRCRQPAVAVGHKLRIFRPSPEEWPSGEGKRRPLGWVTCLRCFKINRLGGNMWNFTCQLQEQGKMIQWRKWKNMQDSQWRLLCDVWQLTPDQVDSSCRILLLSLRRFTLGSLCCAFIQVQARESSCLSCRCWCCCVHVE